MSWPLRTLAFVAVYMVATWAGRLTVLDETNLSLVWPAAGVAAIWFLVQRGSRWRILDIAALAGATVAVNTATGAPIALSLIFVVANVAQAELFAYLYRRWLPHLWGGGGDGTFARITDLWRLGGAAILSTACGALIGPTGVWIVHGAYSWPATAVWMTRNTVSILLIGAAGVRLGQYLQVRRREFFWTRWRAVPGEYLLVVGLSVATYLAVFGVDHALPLAFTLLVMTVWAGLRLRTGFVILHDLVFGTAAVLFTLHGTGPFAAIPNHAARALVAQLFVGMVAVVGLALALGRDERHDLIDVLRAAQEAATGQARLMSTIVDSMSEGLTVVDEQGRVLLRNPAVRHLMGGVMNPDSGHLAKPGFYGLFHLDGTPIDASLMPHRRAIAGDDVRDLDILVRNSGVPDGRILRVSSTVLPDERDGHRLAVTVFHDVTAERRHRDELASFAGVVAHDLLNPLTTVEGWAEALDDLFQDAGDTPVASEAAGGVTRIRRAAARMRNLINDLLAYTTARDATVAPVPVGLRPVVEDIATARIDQAQSNAKPVPVFDIRVDADSDAGTVHADPVLLRQLLDNLISNSIKYTEPGVVPRISVTTSAADGVVTVRVCDNGIGIPAGQHESIFDNFHRAHRSAGYSGTGLGLGICKRIVERHGGTIVAADNPSGGGSRFTFTLPAEDGPIPSADSTEPVAPPAAEPVPVPAAPPPPLPVLTPPPSLELSPDGFGFAEPETRSGRRAARAAPPSSQPPEPPAPDRPEPAERFDHAANLVLEYLHEQIPLAFWAVTRVENGRQTYLYLDGDNGYGLRQGGSHPWEDSFCIHMAAGAAPTVAADAQAVPLYAQAGVNDLITIGTYAGAVIAEADGTLFGAICGLDPEARTNDPRMQNAEPQLALLGQLLTAVLAADRAYERAKHALLLERMAASETDRLTGLPNARAWDRIITEARAGYERLADPTVTVWLDVLPPSPQSPKGPTTADAYRLAAAGAARRALREGDIVARVDDDRFGILLRCEEDAARNVATRLRIELDAAGVAGTVDYEVWTPGYALAR